MDILPLAYNLYSINIQIQIECPPEQFGLDCRERCSGQCINNEACDHASGVCSSGCQDGYIGTRCDECKT